MNPKIFSIVHALAAGMSFSQEVVEDVSQSVQQSMSVVSVQKDGSTAHRRHHSFDHLDSVMECSSRNANAPRKTMSGSLGAPWTLGDSLSNFSHGNEIEQLEQSRSLSSFDAITVRSTPLGKSVARQRKLENLGSGRLDQTGKRMAPSLKSWRTGEVLWQSRQNRIDIATSESHSIEVPTTSSDFADWISSSRHLEFVSSKDSHRVAVSTSRSLHLASLNVLTSYNSRSSSAQDGSPSEQLGHLESCDAPLSIRWREIQGAKNWNGLLDPLDLDLRKEILRYGDFATLTYDNFECETRSKYAGSARFQKQKMFEKLHKQDNGYQVTRYLYTTCENPLPRALQSSLFSERWDIESNWMGYVAVATEMQEIERLGRRDIVVAWRGTVRAIEWLIDAEFQMVPITTAGGNSKATKKCPKVEKGFRNLYTCKRSTSQFNRMSASEQVSILSSLSSHKIGH